MSNNLQKYMKLPKKAVIRINMAWVRTLKELENILEININHKIYLDFPSGRTKPPVPTLKIEDAYDIMKKYKNIKYFAVSNVEKISSVLDIKSKIPNDVIFIPKIETREGVDNLGAIIDCGINKIMLDGEDLYTDLNKDNNLYFDYVNLVRNECEKRNVELLELQGVTFTERKK